MLDATRSRIQTVYAFPRAGVYAPRRILYDAVDCVARQPVRSFINLHPKMRTAGVIDHPKSVRGSDPQSPAAIDEQLMNCTRWDAVGLFEPGELPAVVAMQNAVLRAHPDVAVPVFGKGGNQIMLARTVFKPGDGLRRWVPAHEPRVARRPDLRRGPDAALGILEDLEHGRVPRITGLGLYARQGRGLHGRVPAKPRCCRCPPGAAPGLQQDTATSPGWALAVTLQRHGVKLDSIEDIHRMMSRRAYRTGHGQNRSGAVGKSRLHPIRPETILFTKRGEPRWQDLHHPGALRSRPHVSGPVRGECQDPAVDESVRQGQSLEHRKAYVREQALDSPTGADPEGPVRPLRQRSP